MENTLQEKLSKALLEDADIRSRYPFPVRVEVRTIDEDGPYPSAVLTAIVDEAVITTVMFGWTDQSFIGGSPEKRLKGAWYDLALELDPLVEVYNSTNLIEYLLHPNLTVRLYARALQRKRVRENRI